MEDKAVSKLIIEIYEYTDDSSSVPAFEYIPCDLSAFLKKKNTTLKEIIERGFNDLPKGAQNSEKRAEVFRLLEDANLGRISVAVHPPKKDTDACVELTNLVPADLTNADARRREKHNKDSIILKGRYRLSEGNETTTLKDAQRLTLYYTNTPESGGQYEQDEAETAREITLNITYFQE